METDLMPLIMSVPKAIQEAPIRSWTWMIINECGILEEIEITHFPDGREIHVHPILSIINNILRDCVIDPSQEDSKDEAEVVDEVVQHEINKLSPKLAYKSSEDGDVHEKTIDVFKMLSNYPWEAKLTLALAALVTNYGEYWVISQSNPKGELTKMMKFLRQMGENIPEQQSRFDVLHDLMESMSDMIKGILKIKEFMFSTEDETAISIAITIIMIASYWTVRSIVTSVPYIHSLFAEDYEPCASKEREVCIMTRKIRALLECLQNHGESSGKVTDDGNNMEKHHRKMLCGFDEEYHGDNMWILNFLFNSKGNNDLASIVDCSTNQLVEVQSLKKKNIMLIISSGIDDTSKKIIRKLGDIWKSIVRSQKIEDKIYTNYGFYYNKYKLIWFPIIEQSVKWTESMQHKFEEICSGMPFYSTNNPRRHIHYYPTVIKFVKEKFHFKKETIIVEMDSFGNVLDYNVIHMFWIWPLEAFPLVPYISTNSPWDIQNLFWSVERNLRAELFLWVIGGDDMELIKRLESKINYLDQTYQTQSTILYIGKSRGCRNNIRRWEMSGDKKWRHSWEDDDDKKWLFWTRVESMLLSLGKTEDKVAKTLKKLLSYDKNCQTWTMFYYRDALLSTIGKVVVPESGCVIDDGSIMLEAISKATKEYHYGYPKFLGALGEHCEKLRATSPSISHVYGCSRLEFHTETVPDSIKCAECGNSMEKCIALLCCHYD